MNQLTLSDGTVLENSTAHEDNGIGTLFIYVETGYTMKEIFDLLYDSEKSKKIVFDRIDGQSVTFRGYKHLIDVRDEGNGMITAALKKN